ncbi:amino acid permease [Colletotrichum phormii]|uniref:Amino acid permease n=1 Tax=Colletotrichum phormii TaxID=359342 RepID=A0AAJ0A1K7_9PEZI|nr:amino acid permease [Colletotrichum phormii]KAK1640784.1 amino acid permease [Colletotrichum phormii]
MAPAEAIELRPTVKDASQIDANESKHGSEVYNQTRTRKVFSFSQLFAFSLTYMALWEGMCTNMYFALYNGGPQTFIFSFVIVLCGAIAQAASLGEMASIQPVAGAQYHWTFHLAPARVKRFATWIQGWSTWFGYVSLLAGIANVTIILLESMIELNHPDYVPGGWHTSVLVIAMCVIQGLMNTYCFRVIPWVELVAGVLHVCLFVVFVVVLAVMGTRHSGSFFLETNIASGWTDTFIAWNLGMLTCVWSFTGFDSAIHMSEETRKAKSAVPRAMFWSIFMNGCLGFVMVCVILVSMGSIDDALNSASPILTILLSITGSKGATTAMITGLFVVSFSVNLANIASVSRLTWACYVAFGAITSLSSLALYLSYAIAISSMLYARLSSKGGIELGEWNLGRFGLYINSFALVYTLYVIVFLPFPSTVPVTAENMNYCGPVMVFVLLVAVGLWFIKGKRWTGPNLTILDLVMDKS